MELTLYQIDTFASQVFAGNPAAICPLDAWLPDALMQSIAMENNLSETAFFVATEDGYDIRWFTPMCEVDLCGHATLASAYVLFQILRYAEDRILFQSRSGPLMVTRMADDWLSMDFPAQPPRACKTPEALLQAFDAKPIACLQAMDYIVVFENECDIEDAIPDWALLEELEHRGVAITARSADYDFVTRFFAPKYGIDEDPVTGSAFTQLIPYWSSVLGKTDLIAKQISARGGEVQCRMLGERVEIAGQAVKYMHGNITVDAAAFQ